MISNPSFQSEKYIPDISQPEHVSGAERERSGERLSEDSAPLFAALLAQPKMSFGNLLVPESVE